MYCGRGLKYISSQRGINSVTTNYLLSSFFLFNTLKGSTKAPAVDLLRLNTLRATKTEFLTPKRHGEYPVLFMWESHENLVHSCKANINVNSSAVVRDVPHIPEARHTRMH